jgi:hypothetical protein
VEQADIDTAEARRRVVTAIFFMRKLRCLGACFSNAAVRDRFLLETFRYP